MKTKLYAFAALAVAVCAASASAATMSGVVTPIAGEPGKWEVNVNLNTDGPAEIVSFDLNMQGEGGATLNNILGFGAPQTRESLANTPDSFDPNYKKVNDSWFDDIGDGGGVNSLGFAVIAPSEGPNLLAGGLATDVTVSPPQSFQNGRIAHLNVTGGGGGNGGGIRVVGSVAVGSAPTQAINLFIPLIPEPTTFGLGSLGLIGIAALRRRQA